MAAKSHGHGDFKVVLPVGGQDTEGQAEGKDFKIASLYDMIVGNQRTAEWWRNRDHVERLRKGAFALTVTLDMRLKDGTALSVPLIRVERMNIKTVGRYNAGADGYAIAGTIAFNEDRLPEMQPAVMMAHLLKFLVCAWRHQCGGTGEFDSGCRGKLADYGVKFDAKGVLAVEWNSKFAQALAKIGIEIPDDLGTAQPRAGKATSKVWSCTCQRVRVGTKDFFAVCTECHEPFRLGDYVGKRFVSGTASGSSPGAAPSPPADRLVGQAQFLNRAGRPDENLMVIQEFESPDGERYTRRVFRAWEGL